MTATELDHDLDVDLTLEIPCLSTTCSTGAVWATRPCPTCPGEVHVCDHHRAVTDLAAAALATRYDSSPCSRCGVDAPLTFDWRAL